MILRLYPSTAASMTEPFTINKGGCPFTTLKSTLEQSPFLKTMLSKQWADSTCYVNGMPFVDRSGLLLGHILDFLFFGIGRTALICLHMRACSMKPSISNSTHSLHVYKTSSISTQS